MVLMRYNYTMDWKSPIDKVAENQKHMLPQTNAFVLSGMWLDVESVYSYVINTFLHACTSMCVYVHAGTCECVCAPVCMFVCVCLHACVRVCGLICVCIFVYCWWCTHTVHLYTLYAMHGCARVYMSFSACVCVCVRVHACVCVCLRPLCVCVCVRACPRVLTKCVNK